MKPSRPLNLYPGNKRENMRVLVACEFSGIVRDAFIARGPETGHIKDKTERSKARSRTFQGIANAMASQWG